MIDILLQYWKEIVVYHIVGWLIMNFTWKYYNFRGSSLLIIAVWLFFCPLMVPFAFIVALKDFVVRG